MKKQNRNETLIGANLGALYFAKGALALWGLLLLGIVAVGVLFYNAFYQPSQLRQARLQLVETAQTLREYKLVFGNYPKRLDLLKVLPQTNKPEIKHLLKPKLKLTDPWGKPIFYKTAPKVMLISTGPDGKISEDDIVLTIDDEETENKNKINRKEEVR